MRLQTADLRKQRGQTAARSRDTPDRRHVRRTQEIPREDRRATWRERGTKASTTAAPLTNLGKAEQRATRREGRLQGKTRVQTHATLPNETRAQGPQNNAIPPGPHDPHARKGQRA